MGHCRRVLAFKVVEPITTLYSDHFTLELAENFHLHLRNLRVELDHVEFELVANGFAEALESWRRNGSPPKVRYEELGDKQLVLHKSKLSPVPSQWNTNTTNDELRIELQQWTDYVHIHQRHLRSELTVKEFLEFADAVAAARDELLALSASSPIAERRGKFHRANPAGRVDREDTDFWARPPDWKTSEHHPYASSFHDEADAQRRQRRSRETSNSRLATMDVNDLYELKLHHSAKANPWAVDKDGVCVPLRARRNFVRMVEEARFAPTPEQVRATEYSQVLNRGFGDEPRDGSRDWVYADPSAQASRFIDLIALMAKGGYVGADGTRSAELAAFDEKHEVRVRKADGSVETLTTTHGGLPGVISVRPHMGTYIPWNGLHRLAVLKHMWDAGTLRDNRILVRKNDGTPFSPADIIPPMRPLWRRVGGRVKGTLRRLARRLEDA